MVRWDGSNLTISGSRITANSFVGDLMGDVTGNVSGTAGAAGDVALNSVDIADNNSVNITAGDSSSNLIVTGGTNVSINAVATDDADTITINANDSDTTYNEGAGISIDSTNFAISSNINQNNNVGNVTSVAGGIGLSGTVTGAGSLDLEGATTNVIGGVRPSGNISIDTTSFQITANDTTYNEGDGISISDNQQISVNALHASETVVFNTQDARLAARTNGWVQGDIAVEVFGNSDHAYIYTGTGTSASPDTSTTLAAEWADLTFTSSFNNNDISIAHNQVTDFDAGVRASINDGTVNINNTSGQLNVDGATTNTIGGVRPSGNVNICLLYTSPSPRDS